MKFPDLKSLTRMRFRQSGSRMFFLPSSRLDWSRVGDGTGSSTVMACLLWIARTFPEAPAALYQEVENGQEEQIRVHKLLKLLANPNPYHSGPILWMATLVDWNVDGNAYWLKLRDGTGEVKQLWWAPHWMIEPKGTDNVYVSHYEYAPGGTAAPLKVDPADVVHLRFGLDGDDPRKGYSPLKSVLREVFTDDEAANYTAAMLRNMGVPGLIVSPDGMSASQEQAQAAKSSLMESFTGDRRGEPMVSSIPMNIAQFGFSPEQLLLKELRRIPEERVSAVLGVPAVVAGLGAGLDRSTFTNYREARQAAYEQNIIPSQRILAEDLRFQLLPDFGEDPHLWRVGFDLSKVRVLQDDEDNMAKRMAALYLAGLTMRSEARRRVGLTVDPNGADDVYLLPLNSSLVPAGELPAFVQGSLNRSANGNGSAPTDTALAAAVTAALQQGANA